ncbi:Hypothetical protein NTJ_01804 [Nesidiocoris tenuis]|uniref:Uncharacterized protein n=1 Tax=Nesidiocoris tenuis TaxID=355587 RepID=A0ABN7ACM7_9HEMI|nr:Hypothetical protein NTJ_01804 [Nesidiocoris tenuis]
MYAGHVGKTRTDNNVTFVKTILNISGCGGASVKLFCSIPTKIREVRTMIAPPGAMGRVETVLLQRRS